MSALYDTWDEVKGVIIKSPVRKSRGTDQISETGCHRHHQMNLQTCLRNQCDRYDLWKRDIFLHETKFNLGVMHWRLIVWCLGFTFYLMRYLSHTMQRNYKHMIIVHRLCLFLRYLLIHLSHWLIFYSFYIFFSISALFENYIFVYVCFPKLDWYKFTYLFR